MTSAGMDQVETEPAPTVKDVDLVARRRSKLAAPPGAVFAALVRHLPAWWVCVEGEREPTVVEAVEGSSVTWSSPFLWRPHDTLEVQVRPGQYAGCVMELRQTSDQPFHPFEATTLRHRWGEHVDRDLRDFLDDGSTRQYRFSAYRADVEDWAVLEGFDDRTWVVARPTWASVEVQLAPGRSWMKVRCELAGAHLLAVGTILWSFALHRASSVRCVAAQPEDIEERGLVPFRSTERYRGFELVVPVAAFGRELEPRSPSTPAVPPD